MTLQLYSVGCLLYTLEASLIPIPSFILFTAAAIISFVHNFCLRLAVDIVCNQKGESINDYYKHKIHQLTGFLEVEGNVVATALGVIGPT
jgi:hypothetical protein